LLAFDAVLGLGLGEWTPKEEEIPQLILDLVAKRQLARAEKRWKDADSVRAEISAAGYEVMDTPEGPKVKASK
jgi:cysteinyl-tRNA synthetase